MADKPDNSGLDTDPSNEPISVINLDQSELETFEIKQSDGCELPSYIVSEGQLALEGSLSETCPLQVGGDSVLGGAHTELTDFITADGQQVYIAGAGQSASLSSAVINGETVQVIQVHHPPELVSETSDEAKVLQIVANDSASDVCSVIALNTSSLTADSEIGQTSELLSADSNSALSRLLLPQPQLSHLTAGVPPWAAQLHHVQKIGNAYRGWVDNEIQLNVILTVHKQSTGSFWGTRQSPCSSKPSTRLMWKSQYIPFDGIPFLNSGSRAVVMECQFGPRRKGGSSSNKHSVETAKKEFKQTCPARIYIKKVKKFPQYAVNPNMEKKALHLAMAQNFQALKESVNNIQGVEVHGIDRYYVELPTEQAHLFHEVIEPTDNTPQTPSRLDPRVVNKIRSLVANGETRLYAIRKQLRKFVEKLFDRPSQTPEKHNLSFFPTVNDLQNHIHQAVQDVESGVLVSTARTTLTVEVGSDSTSTVLGAQGWPSSRSAKASTAPQAETVTVTLTQAPGQDGQHMISRVETHMSDGTKQVTTSLQPDTAKLLAKLHPNMFQAGSIFQGHEPEGLNPDTINSTRSTSDSPGLASNHTKAGIVEVDELLDIEHTEEKPVFLPDKDSETRNDDHNFAVVLEGREVKEFIEV